MNQEERALSEAVNALLTEHWVQRNQAYSLSDVGTALRERRINYKEMLTGETLKSFILRTQDEAEYRLIEFPTTKVTAVAPKNSGVAATYGVVNVKKIVEQVTRSIAAAPSPANEPAPPPPPSSAEPEKLEGTSDDSPVKRPSLTLNRTGGSTGGRLELKPRPIDPGQVRQSFSHGRTKTVQVEVRKKRPPDEEQKRREEEEQRKAAEEAERLRLEAEVEAKAKAKAKALAEEQAAKEAAEAEVRRRREELLRQQAEARQNQDTVRDQHNQTAPESDRVRKPLPPLHMRPRVVEGIPSVFGCTWSEQSTIILRSSSANIPIFPLTSSPQDHANRLDVCRSLAEDLATDLESGSNVRNDFAKEIRKYLKRLPSAAGEDGNLMLADATARTIRSMFAGELRSLPTAVAANLKTLLEHHIALRAYYPDIGTMYCDIRTGRLQNPLPLDAITGVMRGVQLHTPEIFDPSVTAVMGEGTETGPIIAPAEPSDEDNASEPEVPPDPLGELDPEESRDYQAAGIVNRLWQVFTAGESVLNAAEAWRSAYDTLAPPVSQVLEWLRNFKNPGG